MYDGFRFWNGWLIGLRSRYAISDRASTKQAQSSPADMRGELEKWANTTATLPSSVLAHISVEQMDAHFVPILRYKVGWTVQAFQNSKHGPDSPRLRVPRSPHVKHQRSKDSMVEGDAVGLGSSTVYAADMRICSWKDEA